MGLWGCSVAFFQHITTRLDGGPDYVCGISGLNVSAGTALDREQVFSINGCQGGILSRYVARTLAVRGRSTALGRHRVDTLNGEDRDAAFDAWWRKSIAFTAPR